MILWRNLKMSSEERGNQRPTKEVRRTLGNSSIATEHAFSVTPTENGSRLIPAGSLHGQETLTHLANQFCEKTIHHTHRTLTQKR